MLSSRLEAVLWAGHQHAVETGARQVAPPSQRPSSPPPGADYGQRGPVDFTGKKPKLPGQSRSKSPAKKDPKQQQQTAIKKGKAAQAAKSKSPPKSRPSLKDAGKKVVAANRTSSRENSPAKPRPPSPLNRRGAMEDVRKSRPATQVKAEDFASFQDEIDAFNKDRQKDFTEYKEAEAEAAKCIEARKDALKKFKKEMQGDADRLIESLAEGLKQKIKLLNELQAATAEASAKGESDKGELLSLQSQLAEKEV